MNDLPLARRLPHWFAAFATIYTLCVLASGGLVTSHGVGMAVPDWPTTFGYNMFLFPVSHWVGGVFYEHSHRLLASGIGLLTLVLCVWLWVVEPRKWVKILGTVSVGIVCLQGLLGGLRVILVNADFGIFHGMLAQSFLVLLGILTAVTSPSFVAGEWAPGRAVGGLRWLALALVLVVFTQLGIAATMRHAHAGLSIPDFPAAYGHFLPDTSPETLAAINAKRVAAGEPATTAELIWLQMAHRGVAATIFLLTLALAWSCRRVSGLPIGARRTCDLLVAMVLVQAGFGAWTIWSNKAADIATAHQAFGALILLFSARLTFRFFAMQAGAHEESLEISGATGYSRASA
jgi:cytochrome c oxidase assembly protein subunit 15